MKIMIKKLKRLALSDNQLFGFPLKHVLLINCSKIQCYEMSMNIEEETQYQYQNHIVKSKIIKNVEYYKEMDDGRRGKVGKVAEKSQLRRKICAVFKKKMNVN